MIVILYCDKMASYIHELYVYTYGHYQLLQEQKGWVLLENMVMETQTRQYILAIYSVLEMRENYISVWEMSNQLGVHMIMIY